MTNGIYKDKDRGTFFVQKTHRGVTIKKRGFPTKTEALNFLNNAIYDIDHPTARIEKKIKLDAFFEAYISIRRQKIKSTTIDLAIRCYSNHIAPTFGKTFIQDIRPFDVVEWKTNLISLNHSEDFSNKIIVLFRSILNMAIKDGYKVDAICIDKLDRVSLNQIPKERQILTFEQVLVFLNTFNLEDKKERLYHDYFKALFEAGMRPNEFRALQVKDIQGNYLVVNKTISSKLGCGDVFLTTKNKNSVRKVLMTDDTIAMLKERTAGYDAEDFIFGKKTALRETTLTRILHQHLASADLPKIALYGFRHSLATHLIRNGVPIKVVSKRLGHKDASTTMDVYWHLFAEDENLALDHLKFTKK